MGQKRQNNKKKAARSPARPPAALRRCPAAPTRNDSIHLTCGSWPSRRPWFPFPFPFRFSVSILLLPPAPPSSLSSHHARNRPPGRRQTYGMDRAQETT